MKLSKKFIEDLHKIGEDAFIEKNQWIGKLVPDIIIDNLQKRGINQGDLEGVVCLSVEEAKEISFHLYKLATLYELQILELDPDKKLIKPLAKTYERLNDKICQAMKTKRIEQAEV